MCFNYGMFYIIQCSPNKELPCSALLSDLNILENWEPDMFWYLILRCLFVHPVWKPENKAVGIRNARHMAPSSYKRWH
jgi:hypothetical protein